MTPVPLRRLVQVFSDAHPCGYQTPDGRHYHFTTEEGVFVPRPRVGDSFVRDCRLYAGLCAWSNCDGRHLVVLLPDAEDGSGKGYEWSPQDRASNCTAKDDRVHRCWVMHGDPERPETIHVDKGGGRMPETCAAGAGSIQFGAFHGFVKNGRVTTHDEVRGRRAEEPGPSLASLVKFGQPGMPPMTTGAVDKRWREKTTPIPIPQPFIPRERQKRRPK